MVGKGDGIKLGGTGIIIPYPTAGGWISIDTNKRQVIDELGYKSEEKLETPLFFTTDPQTGKKKSQVEAFDNGTALSSMAAYLFSPLILWLGAQIGKNASISDRVAGGLTLIELERLINVTDRILSGYVIARLLGDSDSGVVGEEAYKPPEVPPEKYIGSRAEGKEKPSEVPKEAKEWGEALPEKYKEIADKLAEKIKKYTSGEIEKLKKGINNIEDNLKKLKEYISKHPELAREYASLLRKIVKELSSYEDIMAVWNGIYLGDLALRKWKDKKDTETCAWKEVDMLPIPENMKYCAKTYIETKDPKEVIKAYEIFYKTGIGKKKYDIERLYYGK